MTEQLLSEKETKRNEFFLNEPLYTPVSPIYKSVVLGGGGGVSVTWACCVSMTISPDFSSASCSPAHIARKGVAVKINR